MYGHKNCDLPIDGFYKMFDTIMALNYTEEYHFNSLLYGGNGVSYTPEYQTATAIADT